MATSQVTNGARSRGFITGIYNVLSYGCIRGHIWEQSMSLFMCTYNIPDGKLPTNQKVEG